MSLFTVPIGDILSSYSGDSALFSFSGEVTDGVITDISFQRPLVFSLEIVKVDDGVEVIFRDMDTEILYEGRQYQIKIGNFERTFRQEIHPDDPDDIRPIENAQIDLTSVIREEIIMATY